MFRVAKGSRGAESTRNHKNELCFCCVCMHMQVNHTDVRTQTHAIRKTTYTEIFSNIKINKWFYLNKNHGQTEKKLKNER